MRDRIILISAAAAAIVIGALVFAGSTRTTSKTPSAGNGAPTAAAVPFTKLLQGTQSTVAERVNYFITSSDEYSELWKTINATGTPPKVDFKTQMVLAVFAGKEPSAMIDVANVEDAHERMVSITIKKPDGACAKKQSAASPYVLVVVPKTSLPLTHEDIVATTSCKN